ncbi:MAG: hypothetical protein IIX36_05615, partial [Clostridia bacterium]|nr:hypothetical protein [Clostridia bacterium]
LQPADYKSAALPLSHASILNWVQSLDSNHVFRLWPSGNRKNKANTLFFTQFVHSASFFHASKKEL